MTYIKTILIVAAALLLLLLPLLLQAQARLMLNGATVTLRNGAYLVVANSNPNAITALNTAGGIVTTDATSKVRWRIGTTAGTYTVPYFFSGNAIPLTFTTAGASGAGYFDLNTYNIPTWNNSSSLPPGVFNLNRNGTDNSARVLDRFWLIGAEGYTTKPSVSNLVFTYRDAEWNAAGNTISEALLKAQRWNNTTNKWDDFAPAGTANTTANTVTVPSVLAANLFNWWALVDSSMPLHVGTLPAETGISLYPNPAGSFLYINSGLLKAEKMEVTDITGKTILKETITPGTTQLDIKHLPAGMYFFSFLRDGKTGVVKFIKE